MLIGVASINDHKKLIMHNREWSYCDDDISNSLLIELDKITFHPLRDKFKFEVPVPVVENIRDFYSFEKHAMNARKKRGLGMVEEWYRIPAYYYQNRTSIIPTGAKIQKPEFTNELDFEAEIAFVIGKRGMNIKKEDAMSHVLGFMLANDWSARDLQREEMKIGLGPSKSKDFGTTLGPYITSIDSLSDYVESGRIHFNVDIYLNGLRIRSIDTSDMYWTIPDLVSYASKYTPLEVGDVFMTGTMANGSQVEMEGENFLRKGDVVKFMSKELGEIYNEVA